LVQPEAPRIDDSSTFLKGSADQHSASTPAPEPAPVPAAIMPENTFLVPVDPVVQPEQVVFVQKSAQPVAPPPGQETQAALEDLRGRSSKHIAAEQLRLRLQSEVEVFTPTIFIIFFCYCLFVCSFFCKVFTLG
jgi:hypothetical protein